MLLVISVIVWRLRVSYYQVFGHEKTILMYLTANQNPQCSPSILLGCI